MKVNRHWWIGALGVAASLAAAGCAGLRTTYLENGNKGYLITCRGYFNTFESCLVKAGRICKTQGYDTIRSDEYDRTLLVACKTSTASR
jgi:hypothetical protein